MHSLKSLLLTGIGWLRHSTDSKILFYHDLFISESHTDMATPFPLFQQHLDMMRKEGFSIVSGITKQKYEIQLCFDDGFRGLWECREFFYAQTWRPTVFIAVELIGRPHYLSAEEILELQRHGIIFQGHGWSHQILTNFHDEALWHEIADSKKYLEDLLGKEVDELCFPVGFFSDEVLDCCRKAGYRKLYSSIPGNYFKPVFAGVVRRNLVQFYSVNIVRSVLLGSLNLFAWRYKKRHFLK